MLKKKVKTKARYDRTECKYIRVWILCTATAMVLASFPTTAFGQLDQISVWDLGWDPGDPNDPGGEHGEQRGGGNFSIDPVDNPASSNASGDLYLDYDPAAGTIRTSSTVNLSTTSGMVSMNSANAVLLSDTFTVDRDWGFVEIFVRTSGSFQHDLELGDGEAAWAPITAVSGVSSYVTAGGLTSSNRDEMNSYIEGFFNTPITLNETQPVLYNYSNIIEYVDDSPMDFQFAYQENVSLTLNPLDAAFAQGTVTNNFGNTLNLVAAVYDSNMNLIEDATITTGSGLVFQKWSAAVPEPGSAFVFGLAGLALLARRRRVVC